MNPCSDMMYKYLNELDGRTHDNWSYTFSNIFACAKGEEQSQ